ncbi:MAG: hypothetical protein ACE5HO_03000 [bacterium]
MYFVYHIYRILRYRLPLVLIGLKLRAQVFLAKECDYRVFCLSTWELLRLYFERTVPEKSIAKLATQLLGEEKNVNKIITSTFDYLSSAKAPSSVLRWLLPCQAAYLPFLDCKGFAVLFKAILMTRNIPSEIWIGHNQYHEQPKAHAWLLVKSNDKQLVCDQNLNGPIAADEFTRRTTWKFGLRVV